MEDIQGIRKMYRKGNGQGTKYRAKMNPWSFYELQRQIEYKARWLDPMPRSKMLHAALTSLSVLVLQKEHDIFRCSSGTSFDPHIAHFELVPHAFT